MEIGIQFDMWNNKEQQKKRKRCRDIFVFFYLFLYNIEKFFQESL